MKRDDECEMHSLTAWGAWGLILSYYRLVQEGSGREGHSGQQQRPWERKTTCRLLMVGPKPPPLGERVAISAEIRFPEPLWTLILSSRLSYWRVLHAASTQLEGSLDIPAPSRQNPDPACLVFIWLQLLSGGPLASAGGLLLPCLTCSHWNWTLIRCFPPLRHPFQPHNSLIRKIRLLPLFRGWVERQHSLPRSSRQSPGLKPHPCQGSQTLLFDQTAVLTKLLSLPKSISSFSAWLTLTHPSFHLRHSILPDRSKILPSIWIRYLLRVPITPCQHMLLTSSILGLLCVSRFGQVRCLKDKSIK